MEKIGIIGNGFVGNAIYHTFSQDNEVFIYDIDPNRSTHSLYDVVKNGDVIFVCVSTPMDMKTGDINLHNINSVFEEVNKIFNEIEANEDFSDDPWDTENRFWDFITNKTFIIKATVVPGTTKALNEKYNFNIIFSPEFLTERTAVADSICSNHTIFGGCKDWGNVIGLYRRRFGDGHNIFLTDANTAEFIKYMRNTFFSTKVTFMNEMFRVSTNMDIDWDEAVSGFALDGRIGHSHLRVPGHDGMYGFGGTCFPKDLSAIINHSKTFDFIPELLETVNNVNIKYRGVKDWEKLEGRAVSNK